MNTPSKPEVEAGVMSSIPRGMHALLNCASVRRVLHRSIRNCTAYIHVPKIIHPRTAG